MRRLALAIALASVLSVVVHAGEISSTGAVATPTPSPTTTTGEIPTCGMAGEIPTTGVVGETTDTVLTIIVTLISIVP